MQVPNDTQTAVIATCLVEDLSVRLESIEIRPNDFIMFRIANEHYTQECLEDVQDVLSGLDIFNNKKIIIMPDYIDLDAWSLEQMEDFLEYLQASIRNHTEEEQI